MWVVCEWREQSAADVDAMNEYVLLVKLLLVHVGLIGGRALGNVAAAWLAAASLGTGKRVEAPVRVGKQRWKQEWASGVEVSSERRGEAETSDSKQIL